MPNSEIIETVIRQFGVLGGLIVVGLWIYYAERRRDKPPADDTSDNMKLWIIENVREPIIRAMRGD